MRRTLTTVFRAGADVTWLTVATLRLVQVPTLLVTCLLRRGPWGTKP
jgi:hypothetical protein